MCFPGSPSIVNAVPNCTSSHLGSCFKHLGSYFERGCVCAQRATVEVLTRAWRKGDTVARATEQMLRPASGAAARSHASFQAAIKHAAKTLDMVGVGEVLPECDWSQHNREARDARSKVVLCTSVLHK